MGKKQDVMKSLGVLKMGRCHRSLALVAVMLGLMSGQANAALLSPGGFLIPAPLEPDPAGGLVLASVTSPFSSVDIQGQVISRVLSGDVSNPLGGLTFTYQIIMATISPHEVSGFSVGNYGGSQTDVSYNNVFPTASIAPFLVSRSSAPGDVVRFNYIPGIGAGQFSALMVVQTDASAYQPTLASVINSGSHLVNSLAPTQVPEPGAVALAVVGGLAIFRLRWHWRR